MSDSLHGFYARDGYAITQLQPSHAQSVFPFIEDPAQKSTFDLTVIADARHRVIANTEIVRDEPLPDGRHAVTFATTPPMPAHLLGFAIGAFQTIETGAIRLHFLNPNPEFAFVLDAAKRALDFYDRWFSIPYPLPKLDLVVVPEYETAAMETTGSIFFREASLREARPRIARLVAHEIAHQWFGSLVTPASWDELWLSEGFATWIASKVIGDPLEDVRAMQTAMAADALSGSRALHGSGFDSIAYEKGAALLRMLEAWIGEEAFRDGVNRYLERHANDFATADDLWDALGHDVAAIGKPFVASRGVPHIRFGPDMITSSTNDPIPVAMKIGDEALRVLVRGTAEVPAAGNVFGNAGAVGYHRSSYARPVDPSRLTRAEQVVYLADAWAEVWDCTSDVLAFLRVLPKVDRDLTREILRELRELLASGPRASAFDAMFGPMFGQPAAETDESLAGRIANPATRAAAWAELKANWETLRPSVIAFGGHGVLPALAVVADPTLRNDIATFFAGRDLGDARRTLQQVVERIDSRIRFRERELRKFDAWLTRQSARDAVAGDPLRVAHGVLNALLAGYHGAAAGRAVLDARGIAAPPWMHPLADLRAVANALDQMFLQVFRGVPALSAQLADLTARLQEDLAATAALLDGCRTDTPVCPGGHDRQECLSYTAAMRIRQATVRDVYLGGMIAFAELFGTAEEADRWRAQLRATEEEVLRARADGGGGAESLAPAFRSQAADLAALAAWLRSAT